MQSSSKYEHLSFGVQFSNLQICELVPLTDTVSLLQWTSTPGLSSPARVWGVCLRSIPQICVYRYRQSIPAIIKRSFKFEIFALLKYLAHPLWRVGAGRGHVKNVSGVFLVVVGEGRYLVIS